MDFEHKVGFEEEQDARDAKREGPPMVIDVALKHGNLLDILKDIEIGPEWRNLADKCAAYYDGNQLTPQMIADRRSKGIPDDLVINLIKPTVLTILGMEEKTRQDWRVVVESGEDKQVDDLAEALSVKLHDAEKQTLADMACSEAYFGQVVPGIGWVEVGRESNPFKGKYRVKSVHRSEIDYDWRDRSMLLDESRFQVRRKWYDNDIIVAMFPDYAQELKGLTATGDWNQWYTRFTSSVELSMGKQYPQNMSLEESEWRDMGRNRTCLFETWYKTYEPVQVMRVGKRVIEFDLSNEAHFQAAQAGLVTIENAVVDRIRQAYWVGPYCVIDRANPYPFRWFPYIPFFGFREDLTGIPYGAVRGQISSQDEYNARRAKMYWLLSTRRTIADADAVLDHKKAAKEVAKGNAYIMLNPDRKPTSQFLVEENRELAKDQYEVMESAGENIQRTVGIQQTLMNPIASSGIAKQVDIEQGVITLARINGNYRNARLRVGESLLMLVKEDIGGETIKVKIGDKGRERIVVLNEPAGEVGGFQVLNNDVQRAMAKCDLDEVPASATYRQQLAQQLMEMTKALPPQIQGLIIDFIIETSDQPKRFEVAKRIRKALNIDDTGEGEQQGPSENEQAMMQQLEQLQAAFTEAERKLQEQVSQNLDYKREIGALQLKREQLATERTEMQVDGEAMQAGQDMGMINAKLEMLAEQVGKLTKAVM